jgi:microcystin-dependent protein
MSEPFLGEIRMVGFNFAPQGWAMCNGQVLQISQNAALFSLLGTTYGGNGTSTFQLPDLRGRVAISQGSGPGLTPYVLGESGGSETTSLVAAHNHELLASESLGTTDLPGSAVPAGGGSYASADDGSVMIATAVTGDSAVSIIQPFLALNFVIALVGIFPSRN